MRQARLDSRTTAHMSSARQHRSPGDADSRTVPYSLSAVRISSSEWTTRSKTPVVSTSSSRQAGSVFCVKCAAPMRDDDGSLRCEATGCDLSPKARAQLEAVIGSAGSSAPVPSSITWGVHWFCPADASPLSEEDGVLLLFNLRPVAPKWSRVPAGRAQSALAMAVSRCRWRG